MTVVTRQGNHRAEAMAPASIANLGVGFDILGVAITGEGDRIMAERVTADAGGVAVEVAAIHGDGELLPLESHLNVASIAALALLQQQDAGFSVRLHIHKGIRAGGGLGSSAASAVAAVVAVNALLDEPLPDADLLDACLAGEAFASGGRHADNVAPCLFGGITLCRGIEAASIYSLPVPDGLYLALATPDIVVRTADARAVLPQQVAFRTMVSQTGAVADLIDAIYRGDIGRIARAMESDSVIEPARAPLIPHIDAMRQVAHRGGALNLVISGSGPTLCAVCDDAAVAEVVASTIADAYIDAGIDCTARTAMIRTQGAEIVDTIEAG